MVLTGAAILPAFVVAAVNAWLEVRSNLQQASKDILGIARQLGTENGGIIGNAQHLLAAIATFPSIEEGRPDHCRKVLIRMHGRMPEYTAIAVASPDGSILCSSISIPPKLNVASQSWFQRAISQDGLAIGDLVPGLATGKPVIHFAQAIRSTNAELLGVAMAAYDIRGLKGTTAHALLPAGAHLHLIDRTGRIAFRSPDPDSSLGTIHPSAPLLVPRLAGGEGLVEGKGLQGIHRLLAFAPLGNSNEAGIFALVSIDRNMLVEPIWRRFAITLLAILGVAAVVGVVAWSGSGLMVRDIHRLSDAASRLADGDLSARMALNGESPEIGNLARTFNSMAENLETRTRQTEGILARLKRANADLDHFTRVAAHDLREPIRQMVTYAQILERQDGDRLTPDSREHLEFISTGAKRLNAVFRDLLDYAQTRPPDQPEAIATATVLENVFNTVRPALAERGGAIQTDDLPTVLADLQGLEQVFREILDNSQKFAAPGCPPSIHIKCQTTGGFCFIHIADNGIGFDAEYDEKVFRPFVRLHPPQTYPGTGIGLAKCRRVVEGWGGTISAHGTPGKGCVITLGLQLPEG